MFPIISNFLEEISSLSHSIVFLYFFVLITEEGFLISLCYSLELCIQMGISFLFSFAFSLLFTWGQTMVEVMKIMVTSFKRSHSMYCYTQCPQPCSRPPPTNTSAGDSWTLRASLGQSLVGSLFLSPGSWCTRFCLSPPRVYFLVLCKFWQLCGGDNGYLLQEGLCHIHISCTQSPCPCGRPLLTHTSTGDAQTQFRLSFCGVLGSWCTQGLIEPSEYLWWEWGLSLSMNSPLLLSCWGFSFALGRGVSPLGLLPLQWQNHCRQNHCRW